MAVILDLDSTLVDSRPAAGFRRQRQWPAVYRAISSFRIYEGVPDILTTLRGKNVPVCIVTSSPRSYCDRVLRHFSITCTCSVCYHDTKLHKPHPAPILVALQRLGVNAVNAVSVGDEPKDIEASQAAGVIAVAALWGTSERTALLATRPNHAFETPSALRDHLESVF